MSVISLVPTEEKKKKVQCLVCTERLLTVFEELEAGNMTDVAVAWTTPEGSVFTLYSCDTPLLAGAVAILLNRVSEC